MKEIGVDESWEQREIKSKGITKREVDHMKKMAGSYEKLFSRRAMKYRQWGLHEKDLDESDYRDLISKEYTFLSRPVVIIDDDIYVGNGKKAIAAIKERLNN